MLYATLDEALTDIATRSFYESATVTPIEGGYDVSDDFGTSFPDDVVMWRCDTGMELPTHCTYNSRVMEPCESFGTASHVRHHLHYAVNDLIDGHAVTFAYVIVDSYPETVEDIADDEIGTYDATIGWALLAHTHTKDTN